MNRWRFVTLVASVFALMAPVADALEMPVRLNYESPRYVTVTHALYSFFAAVAGPIEVGALACALTLSFLAWRDPWGSRVVRAWAIGGTICLVLAHGALWLLIEPVNQVFGTRTPDQVPSDWTRFRGQWEWTHAARAGLMVIGFCALLRSVLLDLPSRRIRRNLPSKDYPFVLKRTLSPAPEVPGA